MSVKRVNFIIFIIVKAFVGEIFEIGIHFYLNLGANDFFFLDVIHEMIVHQVIIAEKIYENPVVIYKAACYQGIIKSFKRNGIVIETKFFVNVELICFDLDDAGSLFFVKDSESELAVIDIRYGEHLALSILFYLFDFDEAIFFTSDDFFEDTFMLFGDKVVHFDPILLIVLLDYGKGQL